jgi:hypothetical protein
MRTKNRLGSVVVLLLAGCGAEAGTGSVGEDPAGEEVFTGTDEQILQVLEKRGIARDQVVFRGDEVIVGGDLHFTRSELLRPQPAAPDGEMMDKGFFCDATVPGWGSGNRTGIPTWSVTSRSSSIPA